MDTRGGGVVEEGNEDAVLKAEAVEAHGMCLQYTRGEGVGGVLTRIELRNTHTHTRTRSSTRALTRQKRNSAFW